MGRRNNGVTLPARSRDALRRMLLDKGVSATASELGVGREHALAGAADLPLLPPAVAAFIAERLKQD